MTRRGWEMAIWLLTLGGLAFALGCGSAGDNVTVGADATHGPPVGVRYNAAASAGELLTYTLDLAGMTYSYEIIESRFGQTGQTGSGTLSKNEDGSYTPSGAPDTNLIVLPNGTLFGAESVTFDGKERLLLYAGAQVLDSALVPAEIAGTYNTIEYSCSSEIDPDCGPAAYFTSYGSLQVRADGTYTACARGDVDDQATHPCEEAAMSGTWSDKGGGLIAVKAGDNQLGTAMVVPAANGGRAIIMDYRGVPSAPLGLLVGVRRTALAGQDLSGTYVYTGDDNSHGQLVVDSALDRYVATTWPSQQPPTAGEGSLTRDVPWTGWLQAKDDSGDTSNVLVLPEDGVFFNTSFQNNSWIELGGKL